jgi:hypothetical protein
MSLSHDEIKAIVRETLVAENEHREGGFDDVVMKAVATILTSFGIDDDDRKELKADFQHLRRWRKSVEQAQSYTFKAIVTVIATGFAGAIWLGIKTMLAAKP